MLRNPLTNGFRLSYVEQRRYAMSEVNVEHIYHTAALQTGGRFGVRVHDVMPPDTSY